MTTTNLQAELFQDFKRIPQKLDDSTLFNKQTFLGALKYVIQCGNFEYDKQLYQQLGIDPGNWTRIMNGSASFPQDKEEQLQTLCGNNGLVIWKAYRRGLGVVPLQDSKDKIIGDLSNRVADLEKELETLEKYGVIRRP